MANVGKSRLAQFQWNVLNILKSEPQGLYWKDLFTRLDGRLHDTDRKGWWWLLGFVPFGGLVLLSWLCSKGSPNSNRFGGTGSSMEGSM